MITKEQKYVRARVTALSSDYAHRNAKWTCRRLNKFPSHQRRKKTPHACDESCVHVCSWNRFRRVQSHSIAFTSETTIGHSIRDDEIGRKTYTDGARGRRKRECKYTLCVCVCGTGKTVRKEKWRTKKRVRTRRRRARTRTVRINKDLDMVFTSVRRRRVSGDGIDSRLDSIFCCSLFPFPFLDGKSPRPCGKRGR